MNFFRNLFSKQPSNTADSSSDNLDKAKKIFFDYECSHFYMSRDGIDEKYYKYHISEEQELEWRKEYIDHWVSQLSVDDMTAVQRLDGACAIEALPNLIYIADRGDSFAKLWIANAIWSITKRDPAIDPDLQKRAIDTAVTLWKSILADKVWLSECHRKEISPGSIKALKASTPEEYTVNYARNKLDEATKEGFAQ